MFRAPIKEHYPAPSSILITTSLTGRKWVSLLSAAERPAALMAELYVERRDYYELLSRLFQSSLLPLSLEVLGGLYFGSPL